MSDKGFSRDQNEAHHARKIRDDRKIAKAAQEQAAAQKKIADQASLQTELIQQTESLKQHAIKEEMALKQRVASIKKKLLTLKFDIDALSDESNSIIKAQKFQNIELQIEQDILAFRDEITDLGEIDLVDELLTIKRTLGDLKKSFANDPNFMNSVELLKIQNLISELQQNINELEKKKDETLKAKGYEQSKNHDFEKQYSEIYGIDATQLKEKIAANNLEFVLTGGFIVFVRRIFLFIGWLVGALAAIVFTVSSGNLDRAAQNEDPLLVALLVVAVALLVVGYLIGRKAVKRRSKVKTLKNEFESYLERMLRIEKFPTAYSELESEITSALAKLKAARKDMETKKLKALELGKSASDLEVLFAE